MRDARHGVAPRLFLGLCSAALLLLPAVLPAPCRAADITLSSRTYLLFYEREVVGGETNKFAPLYEYLSGDASDLGGKPLAFHFYGWGRLDLADDTDDKGYGGDIGSAFLQYLHPTGNAEMRLGRFFFTEGVAAEILDGAFVKTTTPIGFGISLYGGVPVEKSVTSTDTGDSLYGGRIFYARKGFAELGFTYLMEKGDFQGEDREILGGDLWVRPFAPVELLGRFAYNNTTSGIAQQRYVLRLSPVTKLDVAVGYENYNYKDLFQTSLNSAFLSPSLDNTDEVQSVFAVVDYLIAEVLTVEVGVKSIRHDRDDPGDAIRSDLGFRYAYNDKTDIAGLSMAVVSADRDENEYKELRGFATYTRGIWRFTLDALTHRYTQAISGVKNAYQVVGTAGWQVLPNLKISGDLTYTRSPQFSKDYAGLIRASLDLGTTTGGN